MTTRTRVLKAIASGQPGRGHAIVSANIALTFHLQLFGRLCRAGCERTLEMRTRGIAANGLVAGHVEKDPASEKPASWAPILAA